MTDDIKRAVDGANVVRLSQLLQTSAEFVADFTPPDYLVEDLLRRRYVYGLTGRTGDGKTAVAMRVTAHVALGLPLAEHAVERGRVLYLAGENPDDVRARWIKLCEEVRHEAAAMDVVFLAGTPPIFDPDTRRRIDVEAAATGPFSLVVVDTSAAYFPGDDENDNAQMIVHAKNLRALVNLPGGPTVLACCHPVKNPDMTNLLPRGGGGFLNEIDGNLVCLRDRGSQLVEVHWHGKLRGVDFEPFAFKIVPATSERLKDAKGRLVWTVYAKPVSEEERTTLEVAGAERQRKLLVAVKDHPRGSMADYARLLGWVTRAGEPYKSLVQRTMGQLADAKLVEKEYEHYALTKKGAKAAMEAAARPRPVDYESPF
jgi:hypothetical protein